MDKAMFDCVERHYEWEFEFVSGYGFNSGFNDKVKHLAHRLWDIRGELKQKLSDLQLIVKRLTNTLWGKSMARAQLTYKRTVKEENLFKVLRYNEGYVYSIKKIQNGLNEYQVKWLSPISRKFIRPQFGINCLSASRVWMQEVIYKATDLFLGIWYSNTDCFVMNFDAVKKLNDAMDGKLVGKGLGQMDYEFDKMAVKFICVSPKKYLVVFEDGTNLARFPPTFLTPDKYDEYYTYLWVRATHQLK
jgi:DNA polymerase elongation subunit (family B)